MAQHQTRRDKFPVVFYRFQNIEVLPHRNLALTAFWRVAGLRWGYDSIEANETRWRAIRFWWVDAGMPYYDKAYNALEEWEEELRSYIDNVES